jgi:pilus assembly protein CpaF
LERVFYLDDYIGSLYTEAPVVTSTNKRGKRFEAICDDVFEYFSNEIFEKELSDDNTMFLERQKKAIIGVQNEVNYFKDEIKNYLFKNNLLNADFPKYYGNIIDAVFHHNWGLAGIAPWKNLPHSPSAKIVGGRIYYLINGKMELQEQRMSKDRFEQLKKALLLNTPATKSNLPYYELYMSDGERITIYTGDFTKTGQDIMIFRKYLVEQYSFEELANRTTIPHESVPMFKALAQVGFNVLFAGAVGTGKTTFMATWQSMEDQDLEGVAVETDPEIPFHQILPRAPIMQLIADGDSLIKIVKNLMRSDADYLVMAEARDGYALNLAVEMANKGTRRSKSTVHLTNIEDICFDIAQKIINDVGGNLDYTIIKVAKSFHYVIDLIKLPNKNIKKVNGIYEVRYDNKSYEISVRQIMKYNIDKDDWSFFYDVDPAKEDIALQENYEAYQEFKSELKKLAEMSEIQEERVFIPFYSKMIQKMAQ